MADEELDPLVYALAGGQQWLTPQQLEQFKMAQDFVPKAPGSSPPPVAPTNMWDYPGVRSGAKALGEGLVDPLLAAGRLVTGSSDTPHEDIAATMLGAYGPPLAKAAVPLAGVAARGLGRASEELAPPYYSAAAKAIRGLDVGRAVPEQLYPTEGWLSKLGVGNRGVRDELEWAGKSEPPGPYATPTQMGEWARGRMPQIKIIERKRNEHVDPGFEDLVAETPEQGRILDAHVGVRYGPDTHPNLSLLSGENYREVLLTMPVKPSAALNIEGPVAGRYRVVDSRDDTMLSHFGTRNAAEKYRQEMLDKWGAGVAERSGDVYKSGHWDEPNVLAHLRVNDRMVPDETGTPRKTLFIEELQSDWHQKGRKQGYDQKPKLDEVKQADADLFNFIIEARAKYGDQSPPEVLARHRELNDRAVDLRDRYNSSSNIPDAPFKQSWPDLGLKHAIRRAAEEGHEQIAWTSGDIQAARFNLSTQVDAVHSFVSPDGTYNLGIVPKGKPTIEKTNIRKKDLPDLVGKDLAEKIVEYHKSNNGQPGKFEGDGLKVGGERMRSFYDRELVSKANALGKKYRAKVEQRDLSHREFDRSTGNMRPENKTQKVHVLKLTPQLKEAALKQGFPLFAAGGATYLAGQDDSNDELMRALGGGQ